VEFTADLGAARRVADLGARQRDRTEAGRADTGVGGLLIARLFEDVGLPEGCSICFLAAPVLPRLWSRIRTS
jgi:hypothetical protein